MTDPKNPATPSQGTPDDHKIAQDAKESKAAPVGEEQVVETPVVEPELEATPEVEVEETPTPSQAEGTAAATTGEQKGAAAAGLRSGSAPRRRDRKPAANGTVVRAQAKYVRTSARKARLVCDHIRGKSVDEARAILAHTPRSVAEDWMKLLESAVANAEHNHELVGDDLKILQITADEGPTLKRFRPRAMGRATKIRKRTSHLTILLTTKES